MKLSRAVENYIKWKRQLLGFQYNSGARSLRAFSRQTGDLAVDSVTKSHLLRFLDGHKTSTMTWRAKYRMLKAFFGYWMLRGEVDALPMPRPRAAAPQAFAPWIYSLPELRRFLGAAQLNRREASRKIDPLTLRTVLLFLYGAGALISEALALSRTDVDLMNGTVTLRRPSTGRMRTIPIGPSLQQSLRAYEDWSTQNRSGSRNFFARKDGRPIGLQILISNFRGLSLHASVSRRDRSRQQPWLRDFRHTFAVHCLSAWLRQGKDLRSMLPVLAAYMGLFKLSSTEAYLSMTPERFCKQLARLQNE